jgi:hypothetical protein
LTGASVQRSSHLPLTFRHRAGVSPYTSALALAGTCVFVKQSPGPAHCAPPELTTKRSPQRGPLLPKLRGQFAEFLNEGSPVHLGVLTPAHLCRFSVRAPAASPLWLFLAPGINRIALACAAAAPSLAPLYRETAPLEAASPTPPPAYPTASPSGTLSSASGNGI